MFVCFNHYLSPSKHLTRYRIVCQQRQRPAVHLVSCVHVCTCVACAIPCNHTKDCGAKSVVPWANLKPCVVAATECYVQCLITFQEVFFICFGVFLERAIPFISLGSLRNGNESKAFGKCSTWHVVAYLYFYVNYKVLNIVLFHWWNDYLHKTNNCLRDLNKHANHFVLE